MRKIRLCKEANCHNTQTTDGFCRLHYLKNWKELKAKKQKQAAERLNKYVKSVMEKHPNKYIEIIKKDIRSKQFEKYINEEFGTGKNDLDDVYHIFKDQGYEEEVERLIRGLKSEDKF